jgi:hypothetical protein
LGLRVGTPILAAALGGAVDGRPSDGPNDGVAFGFLLGYATAVVIDAAALSYERSPEERTTGKASPPIAPVAAWTPHGGTFGLQGSF